MDLGYARVSRHEQNPQLQLDALEQAHCLRVWVDHASGALDARPELTECLSHLRPGDTLIVWKLDRLGRSLQHLVTTIGDLQERGIGFRCLTQPIDTTTAGGRLIFHVFAALAEFERELIRERTAAGLEAARRRGRRGGARPKMTPAKLQRARELIAERKQVTDELTGKVVEVRRFSNDEVAAQIGVHRSTLYKHLTP